MGVALAASPIGLIAVGIAGAAGLIIANWESVGPFFSALWELIKAYTVPAWEMFKAFAAWTPLGLIMKNWEPIAGFFKSLWDKVSGFIEPMIKFMGLDEGGEGITAKVQRAAYAQNQRNGETRGGGDGSLLVASAGAEVAERHKKMTAALGIPSTADLLKVTPASSLRPSASVAPGSVTPQQKGSVLGMPATGELLKPPTPGSLVMNSTANSKAQVNGELNININGAPPGTRVEQAKTDQPGLQVTPRVGYRTMGAAPA